MKRKLVRQGAATLMVSLPSKWIKQHNLIKGSEVDIEPVNKNLMVSAKILNIKSETEINLINLTESSIRTLITNTYRSGYDKILVNFDKEEQFKILREVITSRLIGFEIIKRGKNVCTVENITEPSSEQFDVLVKKIFFNISMFIDMTESRMKGKDAEEDYHEMAERIQKYDNFCRRVISKGKFKQQKSEFIWTFLALLIHAYRELYHMNKLLDKKPKISVKTFELLENTREIFENVKKAYLEKKVDYLAAVHEQEKDFLYERGYSLLQQKTGKENLIIYHLMVCIRELYQSNSPLSGFLM
ncbi:MAG: hypothetical protein ABIE94_00010 [archaeon]